MRPVLARSALILALVLAAAAPAAADPPVLGVYAEEGLSADAAARDAAAELQTQHGFGSVRVPLNWRETEPVEGVHAWLRMDEAVAAAARRGMTVLPVLFDSPAWASGVEPAYGDAWPPRDPAHFARFAAAAVRRYGPGGAFWAERRALRAHPVRAWEVWNEPNIRAYWRPAPDAAAYARLLRAASDAIHAADPGAEVLVGGLPDSASGVRLRAYLEALYAAGARGSFDGLNVHAYAPDPHAVLGVIHTARRVAARHGDATLPTWVTEFGWASGGEDSIVTVDEPEQATLTARTVRLLRRVAGAWSLRGLFYFNWADPVRPAQHRDIWPFHAGLLRADGSAKPALGALSGAGSAAVAEVSGAPGQPPRRVAVGARVRTRRAAVPDRGVVARVRCAQACEAGLALVAAVARERRAAARHVSGRWVRRLGAGARTVRLRLTPGEAEWLRRRPRASLRLRMSALTSTGAVGTAERLLTRRRRAAAAPGRDRR